MYHCITTASSKTLIPRVSLEKDHIAFYLPKLLLSLVFQWTFSLEKKSLILDNSHGCLMFLIVA